MAITTGSDRLFVESLGTLTVGLGAGDDLYVIDGAGTGALSRITINDTGVNRVQLTGGLTIKSSQVASNTTVLTLSNDAEITISNAADYSYIIGGTIGTGVGGTTQTYTQFATTTLGAASVPATGAAAGTPNYTIVDPSVPALPTFSITGAASAAEGSNAVFTVNLSAAQATATSVTYTLGSTAGGTPAPTVIDTDTGAATVAGGVVSAQTATTGVITFAPGVTSATITLPVIYDTVAETGKGVQVGLSLPTTGTVLSTTAATASTLTPDAAVPTFTVSSATSVNEGQSIVFTVTASSAVPAATTLTYAVSSTNATVADFSGANAGSVIIAQGATTGTFSIAAAADNIAEFQESFTAVVKQAGVVVATSQSVDINDVTVDLVAPVVTAAAISYAENQTVAGTTLGTVVATDNVGVTAYAITTGNTDGFYAINATTGAISLTATGVASKTIAVNDFETAPNSFVLGVTATDAAGNVSTAANITMAVTDVDDRAPLLTGAVVNGTKAVLTFDEALRTTNTPALGDFVVGLVDGSGSFATGVQITGNTVVLTLARAPAAGETFNVTYTPSVANPVADAAGNAIVAITAKSFVVDTTAPVITAAQNISYAEGIVTGVTSDRTTSTVLGQVAATDDNGIVAYNITAGNDSNFFAIDSSGKVTMTAAGLVGSANDFEVLPNSVVLTVTATDGAGNISTAQQLTLTETNVISDDAAPPATPSVITMTTGADNVTPTSPVAATKTTASNDIITAYYDGLVPATFTASTISLADTIDAGAGTADKLTVVLGNGAVSFDNNLVPVINGVEVLEFRSTGAATDLADLTGIAPLVNTLIFDAPSGAATKGATVTGVANLVNTFGLTNSTDQLGLLLQVNSASGLTGSADAVTVNVSNNTALSSAGVGTGLLISGSAAAAGYELVTINSTGGASAFQTLAINDSAAATTMTALTVNGTSNLTIFDALAFNGVGATKGTVAAGSFSGNLNLTFDAAKTSTANTITGGSGNDRFNFFTAGKFDASDVINGGTGTDTLSLADAIIDGTVLPLVAAINATTSMERLELTAATVTKLTANLLPSIHSFAFTNAEAEATVASVENADSFIFTGKAPVASTFTAVAPGAGAVLNLEFSRASDLTLGGTITATDFNTVNVTVTSANGTIILDGTAGVGVASVIDAAVGGTVNVLGSAAAEVALGTGSTLDASTATGKLSLSGSALLANTIKGGLNDDIILGGAFNDVITGGNGNDNITGSAGADTMTGGAGNDTFIYTAPAESMDMINFAAGNTTTANIDKIIDFAGNGALAGDSIQVTTGAFVATTGATASVTAFTVANANNFTDLQGALSGIQVSSATSLSIADITVTAGSLAGRYMVINDAAAGYTAATDDIIALTGIVGVLHASDFAVV